MTRNGSANEALLVKKYLVHMTKGDLEPAATLGYLDSNLEVTEKGILELHNVAMVKSYPAEPKLTALDKLFI